MLAYGVPEADWALGTSRLFLKAGQLQALESMHAGGATLGVQSGVRSGGSREKLDHLRLPGGQRSQISIEQRLEGVVKRRSTASERYRAGVDFEDGVDALRARLRALARPHLVVARAFTDRGQMGFGLSRGRSCLARELALCIWRGVSPAHRSCRPLRVCSVCAVVHAIADRSGLGRDALVGALHRPRR